MAGPEGNIFSYTGNHAHWNGFQYVPDDILLGGVLSPGSHRLYGETLFCRAAFIERKLSAETEI